LMGMAAEPLLNETKSKTIMMTQQRNLSSMKPVNKGCDPKQNRNSLRATHTGVSNRLKLSLNSLRATHTGGWLRILAVVAVMLLPAVLASGDGDNGAAPGTAQGATNRSGPPPMPQIATMEQPFIFIAGRAPPPMTNTVDVDTQSSDETETRPPKEQGLHFMTTERPDHFAPNQFKQLPEKIPIEILRAEVNGAKKGSSNKRTRIQEGKESINKNAKARRGRYKYKQLFKNRRFARVIAEYTMNEGQEDVQHLKVNDQVAVLSEVNDDAYVVEIRYGTLTNGVTDTVNREDFDKCFHLKKKLEGKSYKQKRDEKRAEEASRVFKDYFNSIPYLERWVTENDNWKMSRNNGKGAIKVVGLAKDYMFSKGSIAVLLHTRDSNGRFKKSKLTVEKFLTKNYKRISSFNKEDLSKIKEEYTKWLNNNGRWYSLKADLDLYTARKKFQERSGQKKDQKKTKKGSDAEAFKALNKEEKALVKKFRELYVEDERTLGQDLAKKCKGGSRIRTKVINSFKAHIGYDVYTVVKNELAQAKQARFLLIEQGLAERQEKADRLLSDQKTEVEMKDVSAKQWKNKKGFGEMEGAAAKAEDSMLQEDLTESAAVEQAITAEGNGHEYSSTYDAPAEDPNRLKETGWT